MNTMKVLELLGTALTVYGEAANTIGKINEVLQTAQSEGRDITDEELDALAATTDDEHRKTIDVLDRIIKDVS